jgi:hypothetical protein
VQSPVPASRISIPVARDPSAGQGSRLFWVTNWIRAASASDSFNSVCLYFWLFNNAGVAVMKNPMSKVIMNKVTASSISVKPRRLRSTAREFAGIRSMAADFMSFMPFMIPGDHATTGTCSQHVV